MSSVNLIIICISYIMSISKLWKEVVQLMMLQNKINQSLFSLKFHNTVAWGGVHTQGSFSLFHQMLISISNCFEAIKIFLQDLSRKCCLRRLLPLLWMGRGLISKPKKSLHIISYPLTENEYIEKWNKILVPPFLLNRVKSGVCVMTD